LGKGRDSGTPKEGKGAEKTRLRNIRFGPDVGGAFWKRVLFWGS